MDQGEAASFFPAFRKILDKANEDKSTGAFRHDYTFFVVDAWIPLNLGNCKPDGQEAHRRFHSYCKLLNRPNLEFDQFLIAWRNAWAKQLKSLVATVKALNRAVRKLSW